MARNTISFKIRQYLDVKTQQTHLTSPDRVPSHQGVMLHARFNPAVALLNGANENMVVFASLFRKWAWFGSRFACVPVARGSVDPAHLAKEFGSGSGTIGMDPFDLTLFHAWKRDNGQPQMVPLDEPDPEDPSHVVNYDPYFLMDPTWRKTPVTKPWATSIRPTGASIQASHTVSGSLGIGPGQGGGEFDPTKLTLHKNPPVPDIWDEDLHTELGVNEQIRDSRRSASWMSSHEFSSNVGDVHASWPGPTNYSGVDMDHNPHRVTIGKIPAQELAENHFHLHHPFGAMEVDTGGIPIESTLEGYDEAIGRHRHFIHDIDINQKLYANTTFDYDQQSRLRDPSSWAPEIIYTTPGRLHPINPWRDTKTWMYEEDPDTGEQYVAPCWWPWAPDAYGFYWRIPCHFNTVYQFRLWEIHSFALSQPIVHNFVDPYGDPMSARRIAKYDSIAIDIKRPECIMSDFMTPKDLEDVKNQILRVTYQKANHVVEVHDKDGVHDGREYGELQARVDSSVPSDCRNGDSGNNPSGLEQ